jgi:trigger factor
MQVSVENKGGLERRLTFQVPGKEIQEKVEAKLKELSKQVRIKGFRPGRVPMSVVKQRYGKQVRQDIVAETVQNSVQQAIRDESLRPASMPRMDEEPKTGDDGDLAFSAVIEVYPDIEKVDVGELEIEQPQAEVEESDVDDMLETLREQRKDWTPVERKAKKGDQVLIEYSAKDGDERIPAEGKDRFAIIMGQSGFEDLEKALKKIEPGEKEGLKLNFPADFRVAALAGKEAKVKLKLVSVSESELPEVDEEFIQSFGVESGDLDTLKTEIRGNLERELKQATTGLLKSKLIAALLDAVPDLDVPETAVREEAAAMVSQVLQGQAQQLKPEQMQPLIDQFRDQALGRVRAGLLMGELAAQNGIRADATRVREAIETVASTYEQPAEVVQLYYSNQQLMQQVESSVLEEQVVDWVLENAKVTPRDMKFQDVISEATQSAQGLG